MGWRQEVSSKLFRFTFFVLYFTILGHANSGRSKTYALMAKDKVADFVGQSIRERGCLFNAAK